MLESMRKYHQSVFIYVIFGLLILVFAVNFGPGSTGCSPTAGNDFAARVNGETIPREEWARHYERQVETYRRMLQGRGDMDEAFLDKLGVRKNVMDNLVSARLVAQEAKKRGVLVSDDELTKFMAKSYGVEGVTPAQYQTWVQRQFGMTVERFEQQTREELAAQKLLGMIGEAVDISDAEVRATFAKEHDRAMATYVKIDPPAEAPVIDDATAKAYAESNQAELQERFKRDAYKYNLPEKRHVLQIVKALASDASPEDVKKAEDAMADLKKQLDGGADFGALAKTNSDDEATKDKGGDIGAVAAGELARVLDEQVQKLAAGEVTKAPVRTPRGLYMLKVTEVTPPTAKPFDEVKVEVAKSVLADKAQDEATKKQADALLAKLQSGTAIDTLTVAEADARDQTPTATTKPVRYDTPWVLKSQESIPRIGASQELHDAIFALDATAPIARVPYKVGRSYYVVVYKDREKPDDAKFEETKDELKKQALNEKRDRVVRDWMDELRAKADVKVNPALVPATQKA